MRCNSYVKDPILHANAISYSVEHSHPLFKLWAAEVEKEPSTLSAAIGHCLQAFGHNQIKPMKVESSDPARLGHVFQHPDWVRQVPCLPDAAYICYISLVMTRERSCREASCSDNEHVAHARARSSTEAGTGVWCQTLCFISSNCKCSSSYRHWSYSHITPHLASL